MAPRNKPSLILNRDGAFTEAIGKPATGKPNAFATVAEDLAAKLEAARQAAKSGAAAPQTAAPQTAPSGQATTPHDVPAAAPDPASSPPPTEPAAAAGNVSHTPSAKRGAPEAPASTGMQRVQGDPAPAPARATRPKAQRAGHAAVPVDLTITMRLPIGLTERAEKWAAAAGLPMSTVIRKTLNRMKPQLVTELATIRAGDVQMDRADSVGYRLQTQLRFDPDELAALEARLDPAGFGVMNSMLNYYTRNRFTVFLDETMADAGY